MSGPRVPHGQPKSSARASHEHNTGLSREDHIHASHGRPRASHWQPTSVLRATHSPPLTSHAYHAGSAWASHVQPTGFPWVFHGYFRGIPGSSNVSIPRASHRHPTGILWASHSPPRGNRWASHGQPTDGVRFISQRLLRGSRGATKEVLLCAAANRPQNKRCRSSAVLL